MKHRLVTYSESYIRLVVLLIPIDGQVDNFWFCVLYGWQESDSNSRIWKYLRYFPMGAYCRRHSVLWHEA